VLADPAEWDRDPWSGDLVDGEVWGRGALDTKDQVAASAVAFASLHREGFVPSGDGIASALLTLEALAGGDLTERAGMRKLPQKLVNVRVADKATAMAVVAGPADSENAGLEGRGRVLVRPSGTEQLVRVMVEAPTAGECDAVCLRLVALVESSR
jgi:phosphomannomutase